MLENGLDEIEQSEVTISEMVYSSNGSDSEDEHMDFISNSESKHTLHIEETGGRTHDGSQYSSSRSTSDNNVNRWVKKNFKNR